MTFRTPCARVGSRACRFRSIRFPWTWGRAPCCATCPCTSHPASAWSLGVNGCGKTTLLKLLDGLLWADAPSTRPPKQLGIHERRYYRQGAGRIGGRSMARRVRCSSISLISTAGAAVDTGT